MRIRKPVVALLVMAGALCALFHTPDVSAQNSQLNILSVEPATLNVEITKTNPETVAMVTLYNSSENDLTLRASFAGIDDTAGKIIPNGEPTEAVKKSLAIDQQEFQVPAKGKHFVKITAKDTSELSGGGHYATLVLSDVTSTRRSQGTLKQQLSVGIFLIKREGQKQSLILSSHQTVKSRFAMPTGFKFELFNDGNIHAIPRAALRIQSSDTVYFEQVFNQNSLAILPGKRLAQDVKIDRLAASYLPRKVTLTLFYRAETEDEPRQYVESFWVIPRIFWIIMVVIVIIAAFLGFRFRRFFRHPSLLILAIKKRFRKLFKTPENP